MLTNDIVSFEQPGPEDSVDTGKLQNLDLQEHAHKANTFRVQTDFIVIANSNMTLTFFPLNL